MRVRDVLRGFVYCCGADDPIDMAIRLMRDRKVACLPVVDEEHRPIGHLTERELKHARAHWGGALLAMPVRRAMAVRPPICFDTDPLRHARSLMRTWDVDHVSVVDGSGSLVGLVSRRDTSWMHESGVIRTDAVETQEEEEACSCPLCFRPVRVA
ncbi:MAG: CBS domain-containing protein [Myxococcales bacterium]